MTRVGYLDCIGGLAGDMLLGALLDTGAPRRVRLLSRGVVVTPKDASLVFTSVGTPG